MTPPRQLALISAERHFRNVAKRLAAKGATRLANEAARLGAEVRRIRLRAERGR